MRLQQAALVAGNEGVMAGHVVGGEVLDVGDLPAARQSGLAGQEDLGQGGVGRGRRGVGAQVGAVPPGVAAPAGPRDPFDDRLFAEPGHVEAVLAGRGGFLVDGERFGDL
jgi:hypothetical protein